MNLTEHISSSSNCRPLITPEPGVIDGLRRYATSQEMVGRATIPALIVGRGQLAFALREFPRVYR
jgi:hypothetical protein